MDSRKPNHEKESKPPIKLSRYELKEKIGSGGMGTIYKGFDTTLKRPVAIKIVSDRISDQSVKSTVRERFFNEARAAGGLSHANLVQTYDFGEEGEHVYIVMEFVQGETLEELIRSQGRINTKELLSITKQLASGLAFAHKKSVIHRDIKPSNIIIEADSGQVKLLDFGIAKIQNEEELKLTSTGMVLGSTHYLSPEHITGKDLDGRSDIFCLGTVLYEAATGKLPFRGTNSSTILYKIVHFDPPPPSSISSSISDVFSDLILKCLKKVPDDRFQSCEELEESLSAILESQTSTKTAERSRLSHTTGAWKSLFVRDSQILTALQTQNRINKAQARQTRGKNVSEYLVSESFVTEDELAQVTADCLGLPWIPRGRLKSVKVTPGALSQLPKSIIQDSNILPFYFNDQEKVLSFIIDGYHDFQKEDIFEDLAEKYTLQFYIASSRALKKVIKSRLEIESNQHQTFGETFDYGDSKEIDKIASVGEKRLLLIDKEASNQEAVVTLYGNQKNFLTICSSLEEAQSKVKREKIDRIWANRKIIGDELQFESFVKKNNPSCDIRFYDHLGQEIFQESVNYERFRDFYKRLVDLYLSRVNAEQRDLCEAYANRAVNIARASTDLRNQLDEVYFSVLFWKWEALSKKSQMKTLELFDGLYPIRHNLTSISERYDGRGPAGLRGSQIPLASRIISAIFVFETIQKDIRRPLSLEEQKKLEDLYTNYVSKQLDPVVVSALLDQVAPIQNNQKSAKVAIVDPDKEFSEKLASQLRRLATDPIIYSDGMTALNQIKETHPDLIISEVMVSKLDGFSLCARLKADSELRKIPMVFLSESDSSDHSTKALKLGAEDYIQKSSELQFILAKMEKYVKTNAS